MHHVAMNNDPSRTAGFGSPRIIYCLEIAVIAEQGRIAADGGEPAQILCRGSRLNAERERCRIGSNHKVFILSAFQGQRRYAECPVLINVMPIERAKGGFR